MTNEPQTAEVPLRVIGAGATHTGRVRDHNEDFFLILESLSLFIVADGAGGHNAGDVAAALAGHAISNFVAVSGADAVKTRFDPFGLPRDARRLSAAVQKANRDVIEISQSSNRFRGMGTTVVAALFTPSLRLMHVAHVGDSRCYRLRARHLELLTQDHSLINDVLALHPDVDDSVIDRLPKNVVTRALGMDPNLRVSIRSHSVLADDRFLLCSDGLSGLINHTDLEQAMVLISDPNELVNTLIEMANDAGGRDNIAAVVMDCPRDQTKTRVSSLPVEPIRPPDPSEPEMLILGIGDRDASGNPKLVVVPSTDVKGDLEATLKRVFEQKP